jgi:hypothetical protein
LKSPPQAPTFNESTNTKPARRRKLAVRFIVKCLFAVLVLGGPMNVSASLPLAALEGEVPSLAPMPEEVLPGVVNISTTGTVRMQENP